MKLFCSPAIFTMALTMTVGCSSSPTGRPTVVPTRVQIVHKGQPIEAAQVTATNPDAKVSAWGTTGADGWCKLTTFTPQDGAVPGPQQISVRKVEMLDRRKPGVDYGATSEEPPTPEERWYLPKKYADPKTSTLTAIVTMNAKNDIVLELQD